MLIVVAAAILFLLIGVPIFATIGLTGVIVVLFSDVGLPPITLISEIFKGLTLFALIALPLFMFTGVLLGRVGVTKKLVDFSDLLVGWMKGGLGHVNIVASMFFGGIQGSAVADVAAIGSFMIPSMKKRKFSPELSASITAASAVMGPIIPPSLPMIVLGAILGISVGGLFAAGMIPGIMIGLSQILITYFICRKKDIPISPFPKLSQVFWVTLKAIPPLIAIAIILGGILSGIFTPTEAAAVSAIYALFLGLAYRTLTWKIFVDSLVEAVQTTSAVLLILGSAVLLSKMIIYFQIPQRILEYIFYISSNKAVVISILILFMLIAGMVMDAFANMLVLGPLMFPIFQALDMHPFQFGVIFVYCLLLGQITPPYAIALFLACPIAGIPFEKAVRSVFPYFLGGLGILIIVTLFPPLTLYIPRLLGFG